MPTYYRPEYRTRSWSRPRLVGTKPSKGNRAFDVVAQTMSSSKDIDRLPEFYVPYVQVAADLIKHTRPLTQLQPADTGQRRQLVRLEQTAASRGQALHFLPLERQDVDYTAIFSSGQPQPITVIAIDLWIKSLQM